jgi:hypothetical protein
MRVNRRHCVAWVLTISLSGEKRESIRTYDIKKVRIIYLVIGLITGNAGMSVFSLAAEAVFTDAKFVICDPEFIKDDILIVIFILI